MTTNISTVSERNERDAENLNPHQTLSALLLLHPASVCVCVAVCL